MGERWFRWLAVRGTLGILGAALTAFALAPARPSSAQPVERMSPQAESGRARAFALFDNLAYTDRPDLAPYGFVVVTIVYPGAIWPPHADHHVLPDQAAFKAMIASKVKSPGPIVLDVEDLRLDQGTAAAVRANAHVLATLARWTREAAPHHTIGYYGTNVLPKIPAQNIPLVAQLVAAVDAIFPSMYTFDDDRAAWASRAAQMVTLSHAVAPAKPVYFYLWPQYHENTPKALQFIDPEYWAFQLRQSLHTADGLVLWSGGKPMADRGWLDVTYGFASALAP